MLKNTHIETSTSLVLWFILLSYFITSLWGGTLFPLYPFLLLPILAILPDADHPEGYLNKKFPIFRWFSKIAGHRTWSHDLFTLLIVWALIYLWLWWCFNYYDKPITLLKDWLFWWLKFFFQSPNFLGIIIALMWHTFWDFLTKGSVKFFYWSEFLDEKFRKTKILRYTIGLPFFILNKIQVFLNTIKWGIFPTTWSGFERNVYAGLFNFINFLLIIVLLFFTPIFTSLKNTFVKLSGESETLPLKVLIIILIFLGISVWYFFNMSPWKLKFYSRIAKSTIIYCLTMFGGWFVIYYLLSWSEVFQQYGLVIGIAFVLCSIWVYNKMLKLELAEFNVVINEILLLMMYIWIVWVWISAMVHQYKFQKVEELNFWKVKEEISQTIKSTKETVVWENKTKNTKNNSSTKKKNKKENTYK